MPVRKTKFRRDDLLLFVLAAAGAVVFLFGFYTQLPDSALRAPLGKQEVEREIDEYLSGLGYNGDLTRRSIEARRNAAVIDSLQRQFGRPAAVAMLKDPAATLTPPFLWRSRYDVQSPERLERSDETHSVTLNAVPTGEIYSFSPRAGAVLTVDRAALADVLEQASPEHADLVAALTREDIADRFVFDSVPEVIAPEEPDAGTVVRLPRELAEAIARSHLGDTYWGGRDLRVDSIMVRGGEPGSVAEVSFVAADEEHLAVTIQADVTAAGALQSIGVSLPGRGPAVDETGLGTDSWTLAVGGLQALVYLMLSLILVVSLFRRIRARAVDFDAPVKDGLLGLVLMIVYFGTSVYPRILLETQSIPGLFAIGVGLFIGAVTSALYLFVLAGASDSATRDVWPEKLETVSLARRFLFANRPVGLALLRGAAGALVLAGAFMSVLWLAPGVIVTEEPSIFAGGTPVMHVLSTAALQIFMALLLAGLILGGVGSLLRHYNWPAVLNIAALTGLLMLANIAFADLSPSFHEWTGSAAIGLGLAVLFWRYDFLTALASFAAAGILWGSAAGWALGGATSAVTISGGVLPLAVMLVVGFVGVRSGREGEDLPRYVPRYIEELARQQHVERELDIARQVQKTFLPRRMPRLQGASVGALCIPAYEVGGDYYDFMQLDDHRTAIVIGDVSGKGIQAAFYMTLVKGFVQTLCCETHTPLATLERINYLFCRNAPRGTFVSLIFGIFDQRRGTFTFARAGHSPVIQKKAGGSPPQLFSPSGIAVGLTSDGRFRASIREETLVLGAGDSLILYTDGISEAVDRRNDQFGEERLLKAISSESGTRAEQVIDAVTIAVQNFARGVRQHDDMTMVVLKMSDTYLPESPETLSQATTTCYADRA